MSERTLKQLVGALAVVAVLWVVAWLFASGGGGTAEAPADLASAFEDVDETSVAAVRFIGPEDTIELRSVDGSWQVNGFRADSGSVARFFASVAEATVGDLVATNPANHDRMGVSADSARTLEIDARGSTRSLLIGSQGPSVTTAYARLPAADEVYLLEGGIRSHLTRDLEGWRNRRMIAIDTAQVARITVERDDASYTLVRGDSAWAFEDGSATVERQVRNVLEQLGGALVASRFVADADSLAALPPGGTTTAYSEAGDVLAEVTFSSGTGERWAVAEGDSVRYRIASFRADLIGPTREAMTPE
jgi:hypothetical protein